MKKSLKIAGCVLLMLVGLWGGAVGMHFAPDWLGFPILMTSVLLALAGFTGAMYIATDGFTI